MSSTTFSSNTRETTEVRPNDTNNVVKDSKSTCFFLMLSKREAEHSFQITHHNTLPRLPSPRRQLWSCSLFLENNGKQTFKNQSMMRQNQIFKNQSMMRIPQMYSATTGQGCASPMAEFLQIHQQTLSEMSSKISPRSQRQFPQCILVVG